MNLGNITTDKLIEELNYRAEHGEKIPLFLVELYNYRDSVHFSQAGAQKRGDYITKADESDDPADVTKIFANKSIK